MKTIFILLIWTEERNFSGKTNVFQFQGRFQGGVHLYQTKCEGHKKYEIPLPRSVVIGNSLLRLWVNWMNQILHRISRLIQLMSGDSDLTSVGPGTPCGVAQSTLSKSHSACIHARDI